MPRKINLILRSEIYIFAILFNILPFFFSSCNNMNDENIIQKTSANEMRSNNLSVIDKDSLFLKQKKKDIHLDSALYDSKLLFLCHNKPSSKWPVIADYPLPGAILPFKRIIAYYGNFYCAQMGILGVPPTELMLQKLQKEVENWENADTSTEVIPALHYIAVTAQHSPGLQRKYRLRMPFSEITKTIQLAKKINALVFLDVQIGHSSLQEELPVLESFLSLPNVHLGIDPEYSMKNGEIPCSKIGTFNASDINYAVKYLAQVRNKYHIPPKILIVHRFNKAMVTNYNLIETCPEVQIVMNMDGFGFPDKKRSSYTSAITNEPVQFAGFKIFYKYDIVPPKWAQVMQPKQVLALYPAPIYIQYQ